MCNGGTPPERILRESLAGTGLVIGADGGGNILLAMNVVPDVVIGDLDSFVADRGRHEIGNGGSHTGTDSIEHLRDAANEDVHAGKDDDVDEGKSKGEGEGDIEDNGERLKEFDFEIIHDSDQETNDLEKALNLALERGSTEVVILGATGIRLDHTLKNLSVLLQFNDRFQNIIFRDASCEIRILPRDFTMETHPGQIFSLFPLSGRVDGITTEGLRYALNNESLENGVRDGSSNEANGKRVRISHKNGDLLLITPHHKTD
jgi:thiamine pyrophosphokinase